MKMTSYLLSFLSGAIGGSLVAFLGHLLTTRREAQNRRREQRTGYLVSIFHTLAKVNNADILDHADDVRLAVADAQLFGTPKQVALVDQFRKDLQENNHADMGDLLQELRDSLRAELKMEPIEEPTFWTQIKRNKK